jgi:hypothetical protein
MRTRDNEMARRARRGRPSREIADVPNARGNAVVAHLLRAPPAYLPMPKIESLPKCKVHVGRSNASEGDQRESVIGQTASVSQESKAWNAGYAAGMRALARGANPFPVGSRNALAWTSGYMAGNAQLSQSERRHARRTATKPGGTRDRLRSS